MDYIYTIINLKSHFVLYKMVQPCMADYGCTFRTGLIYLKYCSGL